MLFLLEKTEIFWLCCFFIWDIHRKKKNKSRLYKIDLSYIQYKTFRFLLDLPIFIGSLFKVLARLQLYSPQYEKLP